MLTNFSILIIGETGSFRRALAPMAFVALRGWIDAHCEKSGLI